MAPENTLLAFQRALDCQADGIELDIQQVDGELFVFHDRYLSRLTGESGRIQDLSAPAVRQLKVFGQQPVPTLKQALACIQGQCLVNIELKGPVDIELLLTELRLANRNFGFSWSQLLISSFNHFWLKHFKSQCPQAPIGALTANCLLELAAFADKLGAWSLHASVDFVTPELIADAQQRGLKVWVYTVDEPEDLLWLAGLGVEAIFTNHPLRARRVLRNKPSS